MCVCVCVCVFVCACSSKLPAFYKVVLGIHRESAIAMSKQEKQLVKLILEPSGADIALLKLSTSVLCKSKASWESQGATLLLA